ncbi:MAG: Smr/MutS family protein [Desulfobacula sp.]|nr:Smr/MutS family protein [Desulfobacula sp.]
MGNKEKKYFKKLKKNNLPIFDSDHDFLKVFEKKEEIKTDNPKKNQINKHGVQVLDDLSEDQSSRENIIKEDFTQLLEESFKNGKAKSVKKTPPMSIKKRIKRYPGVEVELDLHGYNAIGAQVKAESFIHSCKHQGFFTLRIIVGKGLHSDTGPVLPDIVEDVLQEMKKQNLVIWYEWDKKKKSKSGAVIVYLKQFERFE